MKRIIVCLFLTLSFSSFAFAETENQIIADYFASVGFTDGYPNQVVSGFGSDLDVYHVLAYYNEHTSAPYANTSAADYIFSACQRVYPNQPKGTLNPTCVVTGIHLAKAAGY